MKKIIALLLAVCLFWNRPNLKILGMKLAVFAVLIMSIIPLSVRISDMIYEVNKVTVEELNLAYQETLPEEETMPAVETVPETEPAEETDQGWFGSLVSGFADSVEDVTDKVGEAANKVVEQVGQSVSNTAEEARELLNRFVDAIALFVITYCAIPVIVVLVMVWFVKFMFQIQIPVSEKVRKPFGRKKQTDDEEKELATVS